MAIGMVSFDGFEFFIWQIRVNDFSLLCMESMDYVVVEHFVSAVASSINGGLVTITKVKCVSNNL